MKLRTALCTVFILIAVSIVVADQPPPDRPQPAPAPRASTPQPAPAQTPAAKIAAAAPTPRRTGQPVNVKIEVTISDQYGVNGPVSKKTVTVVTGDNMTGFIRTEAQYSNIGAVPLNVDTEPEILNDGKIRLRLNLQYDLPGSYPPAEQGPSLPGRVNKTQIRENLALILENGKSIVAAQSADPVGDRHVTIDVKATILK